MNMNRKSVLGNLDYIIAAVALFGIVFFVIINVFCRYILGFIFNWMEELATIMFVWCTYMGIAAAYRTHDHVGINIIVNLLPEKLQFVIEFLIDLFVLALDIIIFILSVRLCISSWGKITPIIGLSYTFVNASISIGFLLLIVYTALRLFEKIKRIRLAFLSKKNRQEKI